MHALFNVRTWTYFSLACCLLIPLILSVLLETKGIWMGSGVVFGLIGWRILFIWEKTMRRSVAALVRKKIKIVGQRASQGERDKEILLLELQEARKACRALQEEMEIALNHKESLLAEYQKTIAEQRGILEKRQHLIVSLQTRVRDLMGEIHPLISPHSHLKQPVSYDYSLKLQKYIDKTERLTGIDHLAGGSPRFLDLSSECYAVDRRRLADSFKEERVGIVSIYSFLEGKFVFVNSLVKNQTGWSPEKFANEFPTLIQKGVKEWEDGLMKAKHQRECSLRLSLHLKEGGIKVFDCYLGVINRGPFAQHILGLFTNT